MPDRRVVSLFSGGGGSSLGYRMAGFHIVWANEFVPLAADTYAANMDPSTILSRADIRTVEPSDILEATRLDVGELDVLDGSPPCSSFSTIGRGASEWGKTHRYGSSTERLRTDDLFFHYVRILEGLQPKAFVAENVTGLVKGVSRGYFKIVHAAMQEAGYNVRARVVNAAWLGVPQARRRVIFVGVRRDLKSNPAHPEPEPEIATMRSVFPYMTRIGTAPALREFLDNPGAAFVPPNIPCPTIVTLVNEAVGLCITRNTGGIGAGPKGDARDVLVDTETSFDLTYPDRELYRGATRRAMAKGARAVTVGGVRRYSLMELRQIFSFPPDYQLFGDYKQRWERLGRSVPPLMMRAIAETVDRKVLG